VDGVITLFERIHESPSKPVSGFGKHNRMKGGYGQHVGLERL